MNLKFNSKISFGVTISTSVALIIIGAFLIKYQIDPSGSLFYLIGIIIGILGFISLLELIAGRRKGALVSDYVISTLLLVVGILIAIFSEPIQAFGLLVIGAIFIFMAIRDILTMMRTRSKITLIFAILRLFIGLALVLTGTGEAFTSNNEFVARLWEIIGYVAVTFGVTFLTLETFEDQD